MANVAIIPARMGSKRLKNKNLLGLGGKPLIYWTIKAALESKHIDRVLFTTESEEMALEAAFCGNLIDSWNAPSKFGIIKRPPELAYDQVQNDAVGLHAIHEMGLEDDTIIFLQPTSPFRTARHIDEAFEILGDFIESTTIISLGIEPGFFWTMKGGELTPAGHNPMNRAGEQWTDWGTYKENGALYIFKAQNAVDSGCLRPPPYTPFFMDKIASIDINTAEDLAEAEKHASKFLD